MTAQKPKYTPEPEIVCREPEFARLTVAAYLATFGDGSTEDGNTFYNYGSEGDNLDYLTDKLTPAMTRLAKSGTLSEEDRKLMLKVAEFIAEKKAAMRAGEPFCPVVKEEETFQDSNLHRISYAEVLHAMKGENFPMRLSPEDSLPFVTAVNMGIDGRLQACFMPSRGDTASVNTRKIATLDDQEVHGLPKDAAKHYINVEISPASMCVLLRRLFNELPDKKVKGHDRTLDDYGSSLASGIMQTLGFNEYGEWSDPDAEDD